MTVIFASDPSFQHTIHLREDDASLQRGARIFMNYCSGCHGLQYVRYQQLGLDLGIFKEDGTLHKKLIQRYLMFNETNPSNPIIPSLKQNDAIKWFGKAPPDLTLETRIRGANWVYHYLNSFCLDKKQAFGVNNLIYPNTKMPNVLESLSGQAICRKASDGKITLLRIKDGQLTQAGFEDTLLDLVSFLHYTANPHARESRLTGYFYLLILGIVCILLFLLKENYWKTIKKQD